MLLGKDHSSGVPGPRHATGETAIGGCQPCADSPGRSFGFRAGRAFALLAGILVAATAFTVLTAAARTAQIRTIGTVSAHFRPAYDILVRPAGARSKLESATGTVQPDFLSGIYGGITMAQYRQIQKISGVSVAAPIAMVGYGFMNAIFPVWLPAADVSRPGRQLYRVNTTWVSAGGASRVRQPPGYVYVTPDRVQYRNRTQATSEILPGGPAAVPCPAPQQAGNPFAFATLASASCFSKADGQGAPPGTFFLPNFHGRPGFAVDWQFPMLLAAVDPAAEAKLDGLNHAVASGHYLPENYASLSPDNSYRQGDSYPVLAATGSGIGEYAENQVQELASPPAPPVLNTAAMRRDATLPGHPVLSSTTTARQAYDYLLGNLRAGGRAEAGIALWTYWSAGPVRYRRASHGDLVPETVRNPVSVWGTGPSNLFYPPLDNAGTQYRTLRQHAITAQHTISPTPQLIGTFEQGKIAAFDPLSRVPLGPYTADAGRAGQRGQPAGAGRRGPAAQHEPGWLRQPAGADDHHTGGAAHRGVAQVHRRHATAPRPDQRDPGPRRRRHRPRPGIPQPDQDGRRADRAAHPPDRGHRGRLLPGAHHGRAAGRPVRLPRAAAQRRLGEERRRDLDPDRGGPQQRAAVRADPRGLRAVRGQLRDRRGAGPPARNWACWPRWAGPGRGCSPRCSAKWR